MLMKRILSLYIKSIKLIHIKIKDSGLGARAM